MGKVIKFDSSRKIIKSGDEGKRQHCEHKQVIAYTFYRTVRCSICGTELDPFDVLVDMLKSHVPEAGDNKEEQKLLKEVKKRKK